MARQDNIQATQGHHCTNGGFGFPQCNESSAEIGKSELGLSNVSRSQIVLANLLRTDRRLPWPRQLDVAKREQALERLLPKAQNHLYRLAEQLNGDLPQKEDRRDRYQVGIPLHVAPQSARRFNLENCELALSLTAQLPLPIAAPGSINPNRLLPARLNRSWSLGLYELS